MCSLLVLLRSGINVFCFFERCCSCCCYSSLFWSEGTQCHNIWKNPKMYKFVYSETTGYYENVPVLLRGTFFTYSVSANKNETFIIIMKTWKIMNLFVIWKLSEANIIIFSFNDYCILNRLLKIFCSFFFCHLKGVRNLHLRGYSVVNLYDFPRMRF